MDIEFRPIGGFNPDWVSPPGHTIEDVMEEQGISKGDFCRLCNFSLTFLNYLLVGDALINEEIAEILSRVLGASKEFWLKREETFRRDSERLGKDVWWTYNENGERTNGLKAGDKLEFHRRRDLDCDGGRS